MASALSKGGCFTATSSDSFLAGVEVEHDAPPCLHNSGDQTTSFIQASTTNNIVFSKAVDIFSGVGSVLLYVIPFAIAMLIFYIGWRWARRAISGR